MKEKLKELSCKAGEKLKSGGATVLGRIKPFDEKFGRTRFVLVGTLAFIVLLTLLLMVLGRPEPKLQPADESIVPITILKVMPADVDDVVYLPGRITADVDATLTAEISGLVTELLADRGDTVTKGQVLVQLDDRTAHANVERTQITLVDARRNLERFEKLGKTGAVSQKDLDDIRQVYALAKVAHDEAKIVFSQTKIKSPIDGVVNDRFVEEGEYIMFSKPVMQVVTLNPVKLLLEIPEQDVFSLQTGGSISFTVPPLPEQTFEGTVSFVAEQASQDNNAFAAEVVVDNRDGLLKPGMIATVRHVRVTESDAIALPLSAIIPQKGEHIAFVIKNGRAIQRRIVIDRIVEKQALISSGVTAGDLVVLDGNRMLVDGTKVEIRK